MAFLSLGIFLLGCTGSKDDTAPDTDTDTETGVPDDTGIIELSPQWDCEQRFWAEGGSVVLGTETETSAFCDSYNAVQGDLVVELGRQDDPIQTLDGISCICEVTGSIEIFYLGVEQAGEGPPPPHASADLELDNLRTVGGDLLVHHVPGITSVEGIYQLESVGGDLILETNGALGVVAFDSLQTVGGRLALLDLDQLQALIAPLLSQAGSIEIGDGSTWHSQFVYLSLESLAQVEGALVVSGVPRLNSLKASALGSVGEEVRLGSTCEATLDLPSLASAGSFSLLGNCGLEDLAGVAALETLTGAAEQTVLNLAWNDGLDAQELEQFQSGLSLAGSATVQPGGEGGCNEWFSTNWGQTQTDICN